MRYTKNIHRPGQGTRSRIESCFQLFHRIRGCEQGSSPTYYGYFIIQSKPFDSDIPKAIEESKLKPKHQMCCLPLLYCPRR
ncbi:DUF5958 family protein [Bacteroides sp. 51]|uniref:DUF5958 family protein n=1 Tax=Bacteroides sp. 51 TaxID=2302938 RepID=UPI00351B4640